MPLSVSNMSHQTHKSCNCVNHQLNTTKKCDNEQEAQDISSIEKCAKEERTALIKENCRMETERKTLHEEQQEVNQKHFCPYNNSMLYV